MCFYSQIRNTKPQLLYFESEAFIEQSITTILEEENDMLQSD